MAAAGGMQLGRVLLLSTQLDYSDRSAIILDGVSLRATSATVGTVVMRPSIPVSVTVYGRWELIPKP